MIFFRELQYTERVKRVAESLPILDQIAQMLDQKKLSPEQAELLRRDLVSGATKFLETGSLIPEFNDQSRYSPHTLIQPSPRLLLEGPDQKAVENRKKGKAKAPKRKHQSKDSSVERSFGIRDIEEFIASSEALSDEERRKLFDLLKKRKS